MTRKNDAFDAKIVNRRLTENFHCHFCSRRKAAKFCHPVHDYIDYDDYNNYNVYRDSDLDLDLDYLLIIFIYWTQWYMI